MKQILIVTYETGCGEPFAAETLDQVLQELERSNGGSGFVSSSHDKTQHIEWVNDIDQEFDVWVERSELIERIA